MDIIKASLMAAVSGGSSASLGTKSVTANGTYTASTDGYDGYSTVTVALPLGSKSVTANDTYTATDDGYQGYSSVTVNVPTYEEEYEHCEECFEAVSDYLETYGKSIDDCDDVVDAIDEIVDDIVPEIDPTTGDPVDPKPIGKVSSLTDLKSWLSINTTGMTDTTRISGYEFEMWFESKSSTIPWWPATSEAIYQYIKFNDVLMVEKGYVLHTGSTLEWEVGDITFSVSRTDSGSGRILYWNILFKGNFYVNGYGQKSSWRVTGSGGFTSEDEPSVILNNITSSEWRIS